jgi:hypothetical protein
LRLAGIGAKLRATVVSLPQASAIFLNKFTLAHRWHIE